MHCLQPLHSIPPRCSRQGGAALITALVFLIIITAIALSSMRASTQELRMALNAESKATAGQLAQALADGVLVDPGATAVVGAVGRRICTPLVGANTPCDDHSYALSGEVTAVMPAQGQRFVAIERVPPVTRPCPDESTMAGAGSGGFGCAAFRVHAQYDGSAERRGRADVYEGMLVRVVSN